MGTLSRSYPACGAILLIALYLFTPTKQPKHQILLGICFLIPLLTNSPPSRQHVGPASGIFLIKHKSKGETTYLGEALRLQYPCGKTCRHLPSCTVISSTPLETCKKYYLQGTMTHHTSQFIFKSNDWVYSLPSSKISRIHSYVRSICEHRLLRIFPSENAGQFASSLLLGTPLPHLLKKQFQAKGLSHIFAVSGWHFSLISSGLFILLSLFPKKMKYCLTLGILSLFTLIFPFSPSVWRSWVSLALLYLSPYSLGMCSSLNRIGVGFIICSSIFPIHIPAFSLSFLSTLGILLFFSPIFHFLSSPWRYIMPSCIQPFLRYIWTSLSLSISSQIFLVFPMMQFFGSLPLEGCMYNLLVPIILLPLFFLILLSFFFSFLSPVTEVLIHYTLSFPPLHSSNIFLSLTLSPLPPLSLTLLLSLLLLIGVCLKQTPASESPL